MKYLTVLLLAAVLLTSTHAAESSDEKPVKHLEVADVTSVEEASEIFIRETFALKNKKKLDAAELHDIHMITYKLEKSVEYYSLNLEGDAQALAREIAVVVEEIHIDSENNRKEETQQHLNSYFKLADEFAPNL